VLENVSLKNDTFILYDRNSFIVYSPFSGKIARVKFSPVNDRNLFNQLQLQGFFGALPISTKKYNKWEGFNSLTLMLTRNCNLRCVYCYASAGVNNSSMSISLAFDAIKWYISQLSQKKIRITFHGGGEPTLRKEIIKATVDYIEKNKNGFGSRYLITTNGIVEDNFLNWMMNKKFAISISMDGPPEIQNRNRPMANGDPSSGLVEKTIHSLVNKEYPFTVRATYSVEDNLESIVHYFGKIGVRSLHLEPLFPFGRLIKKQAFVNNDRFVSQFLMALDVCKIYGIKIHNSHLMHLTKGIGYFCGAASGKSMLVTHDGLLSGCLEVVDSSDPDIDCFKLGKWVSRNHSFEVDKTKIGFLCNRHANFLPECQQCFARYVCAGGCAVKAVRSSKSLFAKDASYCGFTRKLVPILIKRIAGLSKI